MATETHEIRYEATHCNLVIQRFPPGVIILRIAGCDVGEFGKEPMNEIGAWIDAAHPVDFFIDARDVTGASIAVSGDWALWLSAHKSGLRSVTMLSGSRFIHVTAEFVRRFASLEGIMRVCSEPAVFDAEVAQALKSNAAPTS
ncbi:MAG TPA: hypothetical protein VKU19_35155 [Bryobacteraceae bacterium]|nr:hypothetical protein [Bryobacteraceae bacterium]